MSSSIFNPSTTGVWSTVGVMLGLVALYLVLEHGTSASSIITSGGQAGIGIFKTLQGR